MTAPAAPAALRAGAETLAAPLPPLLAEARQLAQTVILGEHGRRRAGLGDAFWQFRPAAPTDEARAIDWRRSARSDTAFVREKEWQAAQSVALWVDDSRAMAFASSPRLPAKAARGRLLALALAVLLVRGGERVGLTDPDLPPRRGAAQLLRLAGRLARDGAEDYGAPAVAALAPHSRALFVSDFLGDLAPLEAAVAAAADRGVRGALLHILDPAEEAFPYDGRTIFESMGGGLRFETLKAAALRDDYRDRLARRKARLAALAGEAGWHLGLHHTDAPAAGALLWLYRAMERFRRC
ncbi:MAG: DUF58 domain-containing protein [Rhodobacteraceae bacterium]|nr:DUF58 domain-containing protein [Paracoccaceae bacterium]